MTLEEAYYISQIVAVVAIIGSLVAIYFQQTQTNKIARAPTVCPRTTSVRCAKS